MSATSLIFTISLVDLARQGWNRVQSDLRAVSKTSDATAQSFRRMSTSFKVAAGAAAASYAAYRMLKPAVAVAGDLQEEMLGIRAELSGSGKEARTLANELAAIKNTAFTVQSYTPFNMTQIVGLQKELVKAGATVEQVTGKTGAAAAAAALATYEKLDPVVTGKALIGIATPFKIAADQYVGLADQISRASSASTAGTEEIVETAKYAALHMALLGKSSREMLVFSALMAQVGIKGTEAGTAIKNFFIKAAGVKQFKDANGNLVSMAKMVSILRESLKGKGKADKETFLNKIFGEQGMPAAMALLEEGANSFESISKAMEDSLSLTEKLSISMEGFNRQLTSLKGSATSTIAEMFTPALAPLTAIVAKMNEWITKWKFLRDNGFQETVSKGAMGGVVAGGVVAVAATAAGLLYGLKTVKSAGGVMAFLKRLGGTGAGITAGLGVQAATGVTPVFVTNWPAGGIGAGGTDTPGAGGLKRYLSGSELTINAAGDAEGAVLSTLGKAGVIGAVVSLAAAAALVYKSGYESNWKDSIPPSQQESMREVLGVSGKKPEIRNDINLNMTFGEKWKAANVHSSDPNTTVTPTVNRGRF
jgi:TP901 family phage tail tape measure protein